MKKRTYKNYLVDNTCKNRLPNILQYLGNHSQKAKFINFLLFILNMLHNTLKEIVYRQNLAFSNTFVGVKRDLLDIIFDINVPKVKVITGIRRSGKSTLLRQIAERFDKFNYISFDDDRLTLFKTEDFEILLSVFIELNDDVNLFLFDEIQNVPNWNLFVNRLLKEGKNVIITGSMLNF